MRMETPGQVSQTVALLTAQLTQTLTGSPDKNALRERRVQASSPGWSPSPPRELHSPMLRAPLPYRHVRPGQANVAAALD
jgi:hypothetical protein